jgi:hypothetical protein
MRYGPLASASLIKVNRIDVYDRRQVPAEPQNHKNKLSELDDKDREHETLIDRGLVADYRSASVTSTKSVPHDGGSSDIVSHPLLHFPPSLA